MAAKTAGSVTAARSVRRNHPSPIRPTEKLPFLLTSWSLEKPKRSWHKSACARPETYAGSSRPCRLEAQAGRTLEEALAARPRRLYHRSAAVLSQRTSRANRSEGNLRNTRGYRQKRGRNASAAMVRIIGDSLGTRCRVAFGCRANDFSSVPLATLYKDSALTRPDASCIRICSAAPLHA